MLNKILLLFLAFVAISCASIKHSEKGKPLQLNFMTFNVLQDVKGAKEGYQWEFRKDNVIALIKKYETDILCAQEDFFSQGNDIAAGTGFGKVGVSRMDGKPNGPNEIVAIFYNKNKFTVLDSGAFWMSETPDKPSNGWDAYVQRICNWAKLQDKATKKQFFVFNTHLDHKGITARVKSAELVLRKIEEIAKESPVILAGDMNAKPNSEPIKLFKSALIDARDISKKQHEGPLGTYNGADINSKLKSVIDYIFISKQFSVEEHRVIAESDGKFYPSDHLPVLAKLQLK